MTHAYLLGEQAHKEGKSLSQNPFDHGKRKQDWIKGWQDRDKKFFKGGEKLR